MDDLAVQDGAAAGEFLADGLRQRLKGFERISVARHQPAGAAFDIKRLLENRPTRLEIESGCLKGTSKRANGIGVNAGEAHVTLV